jgi:hypothetical protein
VTTTQEIAYTVAISVDNLASLWRVRAASPGAALDAALAMRMHNNPNEPPTMFTVTPEGGR